MKIHAYNSVVGYKQWAPFCSLQQSIHILEKVRRSLPHSLKSHPNVGEADIVARPQLDCIMRAVPVRVAEISNNFNNLSNNREKKYLIFICIPNDTLSASL